MRYGHHLSRHLQYTVSIRSATDKTNKPCLFDSDSLTILLHSVDDILHFSISCLMQSPAMIGLTLHLNIRAHVVNVLDV
jgi:hypothetical protein